MLIILLLINILFSLKVNAVFCNCTEDRIYTGENKYREDKSIKIIQEKLEELGYYQGQTDGRFNTKTENSVIDFQKDLGLTVDGIVGPETWGEILIQLEAMREKEVISYSEAFSEEMKIKVYLNQRTLILYRNGEVYKRYPVTIGKSDSESPVGEWTIVNKFTRDEDGPFGSRWMGLNVPWGVYGIHGTNKPQEIGMAASEGCIRLHNQHVEELYEIVPISTPVKIIGPREDIPVKNVLRPGYTGQEVMQLQIHLREYGFEPGYLDGKYGELTENAVNDLKSQFGLTVNGVADRGVLYILNLYEK